MLATFVVPVAAVATLWRSRWRPRILFGGILVLGLVLMVGAYPLDDTTPYGRFLLWAYESFPGILAVRSGHKAGVLVALGAAALAAVAFAAVITRARARAGGWRHPLPIVAAGATVAILLAVSFPFWTGRVYSPNDGADDVPTYWRDATDHLDDQPGDGRVLVLPSTALGAYTWGMTGDDIIEGILERPSISRGLLSLWSGTEEAANIAAGLDDYVNGEEYEPGVLGPIARRLGIEYVLVRNDLDWATTKRPRPSTLDALRSDPDLELVRSFGAPGENVAQPDPESAAEATLPPVELYRVRDYDGVARAETRPPLLVSGDGDAWPGLAAFDVLAESGPVRYSGDASTAELERLLEAGSPVVISDSNRRRVREIPLFDTIARSSYTLAAGQELRRPAQDLFDAAGSETVAHFPDAVQIEASSYGRPPVPQPYYRPSNAFDGDPRTSWRVLAGVRERGRAVDPRRPPRADRRHRRPPGRGADAADRAVPRPDARDARDRGALRRHRAIRRPRRRHRAARTSTRTRPTRSRCASTASAARIRARSASPRSRSTSSTCARRSSCPTI